jgi:tetratricopeptide (TPR) repeat protein
MIRHPLFRRARGLLCGPAIMAAAVLAASAAWAPAAPAESPAPAEAPAPQDRPVDAAQSVELSDPIEPLTPLRPRTSREVDRVRALALFAAGRVAEQQQKYPQALRSYQRAFRFDPQSTAALKEIVPLAFSLDRQSEAVRYALILAEREPNDPVLLRRLAIYLTEEGNTERAMALYEKALALQAADKPTPNLLVARLEMARLYFVARQFDKAAAQFAVVWEALQNPKESGLDESMQKALVGKPELTYQLMGESFLAAGRPEQALGAFQKVHEAKPDDGLHAYNLARVELKLKQPAQALAKLQPYFDQHLHTQGTAPYQTLADALAELGQTEQLLARLETMRAGDEGNVPLSYFLAQRYREAGQWDKADAIYADMIARHPDRPPIEAFQGLVAVLHQKKDADRLLAVLGDAVGRVGTLSPLGESGTKLVADAETCKAIVASARRQNDEDPAKLTYGARLAAAMVAVEVDDFAAADKFYDLAIAAEPKKAGETLVNWGLEMFLAEQYASAIRVFQRGIDEKLLADNEGALYFYLAGALEMEGRTDEALAAARKAAELQKDSPRFASRPAWIQYHAKRYSDARAGYQALLEKYDEKYDAPEVRDAMRDARLVLSNIAVLENKPEESEDWLEQLLDEFPEDFGALNDLGYLWADANKHLELALEMIQKAVAHDPKNMAYRDSLGWALFRLGRHAEAVAELKVAVAGPEPDGVILDHLGDALHKVGDRAAAVDAWTRAAERFDKNSEPDKAKKARDKAAAAGEANEKQE